MDIIYIWHDGRYRSKVLLSAIPTPGSDTEIKVTEFSYKSQNIHVAELPRPFYEFHVYLARL